MTVGDRVTFGDPEDITAPGEDGESVRIPFSSVSYEAFGTPAESAARTNHVLTVRMSRSRASSWRLTPEQVRGVMVHAALEYVFATARERTLEPLEELLINTATFPGEMPERFKHPVEPRATFDVEHNKIPIGF